MKPGAKRAGRGGRRFVVVRWRPETTKLRAATTLARGWVRIAPRPGYHRGDPRRGDAPAVTEGFVRGADETELARVRRKENYGRYRKDTSAAGKPPAIVRA